MPDKSSAPSGGLTYRDAGVDIDAGNQLVDRIKPAVKRTNRPGVLSGLGGFGALFEVPIDRYKKPVLVSGTDGVGTKLRLAIDSGRHDGVGIDLVAMCVNDILVTGAEPLYFLDYYATAHLNLDVATSVIEGIAKGCELSGAALSGGETAEMPGMYEDGDYDLAGFCVGVVEKDKIIDGSKVAVGDTLIALASSGPHSNGYSLIRKVIERSGASLDDPFEGETLGDALLKPTRIYVKSLLPHLGDEAIHALAHITGGGFTENIPRVLPQDSQARIDLNDIKFPPIFQWLQDNGGIATDEMLRTFNCGVGMVLAVQSDQAQRLVDALNDSGEKAFIVGAIEAGEGEPKVVYA